MKVITARVPHPVDERVEEYKDVLGVTRSEATRDLIRAGLDADERVREAREEERERCEERVEEIRDELGGFSLTPASTAALLGLGAGATGIDPVSVALFGETYGAGAIMLAGIGLGFLLSTEWVRERLKEFRGDDETEAQPPAHDGSERS